MTVLSNAFIDDLLNEGNDRLAKLAEYAAATHTVTGPWWLLRAGLGPVGRQDDTTEARAGVWGAAVEKWCPRID